MFNKELINFNNKMYVIHRRILKTSINEKYHNDLNGLVSAWNCDIVIKSTQEPFEFLFLRGIKDVDFEEIK